MEPELSSFLGPFLKPKHLADRAHTSPNVDQKYHSSQIFLYPNRPIKSKVRAEKRKSAAVPTTVGRDPSVTQTPKMGGFLAIWGSYSAPMAPKPIPKIF